MTVSARGRIPGRVLEAYRSRDAQPEAEPPVEEAPAAVPEKKPRRRATKADQYTRRFTIRTHSFKPWYGRSETGAFSTWRACIRSIHVVRKLPGRRIIERVIAKPAPDPGLVLR